MPGNLCRSYFACTGSEATEAALRLAKIYTGRSAVVALMRGYHGMTHASLAVTGLGGNFKSVPGSGLPEVTYIPAPYAYRSPFQNDENNMMSLRHGLETIDWTTTGRPAAIILEVVMSVGGIIIPSCQYVKAVREWCSQTGTMMIVDEAQSGVGRTGRWFAVEHFGVVPDIITTSKSLGGGVPLCAVTTTPEIAHRATELGYHQSSSHTDDPFLAAVGLANIEIIEREGLVRNAEEMGKYLMHELLEMQKRCQVIGEVRGLGLMIGIEIVVDKISRTPSPEHATAISSYCRDHGLLLGHRPTGAVSGNVIRLLPPLTVIPSEIDEALSILQDAVLHSQTLGAEASPKDSGWM